MTALIVARYTVLDNEKMDAYASAAGPTVAAYGGEFVTQGERVSAMVGEDSTQAIAMVRFPDIATAETWFASTEYSACKPLREAAADMQFSLYEIV